MQTMLLGLKVYSFEFIISNTSLTSLKNMEVNQRERLKTWILYELSFPFQRRKPKFLLVENTTHNQRLVKMQLPPWDLSYIGFICLRWKRNQKFFYPEKGTQILFWDCWKELSFFLFGY